jgi:two-component system, OmpR family, sensor histidine kinase KdpD
MGGSLDPEDTPGGGLTMIISVPAATAADQQATAPGRRERDETAGAH